MTNLEFFRARRKAEGPAFQRVLKAIPKTRLDYRPDPKARTALDLAWLLATEEAALACLIKDGIVEWQVTPAPHDLDEITAAFERSSAEVNSLLDRVQEEAWSRKVRFLMGGGGEWADTLEQMAWGFLFDAIHHRGQLSTYLRPMGGKVPCIYGPSADDSGT
jgi:uncharacterized damage-inducible protein DinB